MKKFILIFSCFLLLTNIVFADGESDGEAVGEYVVQEDGETVGEYAVQDDGEAVGQYAGQDYGENAVFSDTDYVIETDSTEFVSDDISNEPILVDVAVRSLNPVTSSSTTGLKSALLSVLGSYDAIVVEYQYQSSNGYYSYLREIQPDYVWLCSCAILLVVLFCLFRLAGGIFNASKR